MVILKQGKNKNYHIVEVSSEEEMEATIDENIKDTVGEGEIFDSMKQVITYVRQSQSFQETSGLKPHNRQHIRLATNPHKDIVVISARPDRVPVEGINSALLYSWRFEFVVLPDGRLGFYRIVNKNRVTRDKGA